MHFDTYFLKAICRVFGKNSTPTTPNVALRLAATVLANNNGSLDFIRFRGRGGGRGSYNEGLQFVPIFWVGSKSHDKGDD